MGKKKTKWRKLSLGEDASENTNLSSKPQSEEKPQEIVPERTEDSPVLSDDSDIQTIQRNDCHGGVYVNGLWFPSTSNVPTQQNTSEMLIYPNCYMPSDTYYYFYLTPDCPSYEDYSQMYSPVFRESVFLLFPPVAPLQTVPRHISPRWQHPRRLKRYEENAEYAIIPQKRSITSSTSKSGYSNGTLTIKQANSKPPNIHQGQRKMSQDKSEAPSEEKSNNLEISNDKAKGISESGNKNVKTSSFSEKKSKANDKSKLENTHGNLGDNSDKSSKISEKSALKSKVSPEQKLEGTNLEKHEEKLVPKNNSLESLSSGSPFYNAHQSNVQNESKNLAKDSEREITPPLKLSSNFKSNNQASNSTDFVPTHQSSIYLNQDEEFRYLEKETSLPNDKIEQKDKQTEPSKNEITSEVKHGKGEKSQGLIFSYRLNSESYNQEMESKRSTSLSNIQGNQSIYKFAYDENVSEKSLSRSPTPEIRRTPESQVPSSLPRSEIIVHEADSGSEAGSEDIELLPHRYESESLRNENKHIYVNKLSLAVELLRTRETLPYDEEFKRITVPSGQLNVGYIEDLCTPSSASGGGPSQFAIEEPPASTSYINRSRNSRASVADSGVQFDDSDEEIGATQVSNKIPSPETQDPNTSQVNAGYRRFGVQAQHRMSFFPPRTTLVNPCFCCVVM